MRSFLLIVGLLILFLFLMRVNVSAQQGCCSWHGGISYCDSYSGRYVCNDGTYSPSCTCWVDTNYYAPLIYYPTWTPLPSFTPIPTFTPRPTRTPRPTLVEKPVESSLNLPVQDKAGFPWGFLAMLTSMGLIPFLLAIKASTEIDP